MNVQGSLSHMPELLDLCDSGHMAGGGGAHIATSVNTELGDTKVSNLHSDISLFFFTMVSLYPNPQPSAGWITPNITARHQS